MPLTRLRLTCRARLSSNITTSILVNWEYIAKMLDAAMNKNKMSHAA